MQVLYKSNNPDNPQKRNADVFYKIHAADFARHNCANLLFILVDHIVFYFCLTSYILCWLNHKSNSIILLIIPLVLFWFVLQLILSFNKNGEAMSLGLPEITIIVVLVLVLFGVAKWVGDKRYHKRNGAAKSTTPKTEG